MIAEACKFYGWTVEYCLNMPAIRFFAMMNAAKKLHASQMIEYCDIAAIAQTDHKYHKYMRDHYMMQIYPPDMDAPFEGQNSNGESVFPDDKPFDAGSQEAKYAVMSLFRNGRGTPVKPHG